MMPISKAVCLTAFVSIYFDLAVSPIQAAGFSCEKASTRLERVICAVPTLSALDSTLAMTYESTRARLGADVANQLRLSQRSWLRYISTVCGRAKPAGTASASACMEQHYKNRIEQLGRFEQVGPFVFTYISLWAVQPFDPAPIGEGVVAWNPSQNDVDTILVTYPQIARPNSDTEVAINSKLAAPAPEFDPNHGSCDGQSETIMRVTYATHRMVSVRTDTGVSCYGSPHPDNSIMSVNWLLTPKLRELRADDLFGPGDAWVPKLITLAAQSEVSLHDPEHAWRRTKASFLDDLKRNWSFTDFGLELVGTSDDFGCHVGCGVYYRVSWRELKPLLVASAPVP